MTQTSQTELWSTPSSPSQIASLDILARAIALKDKEARLETLLADFASDYAKGWDAAVGTYFRDALDIKQTSTDEKNAAWTQGGTFAFCQGDILYDTPLAYQEWGTGLQHIGKAYQVTEAISARPEKEQVFYRKSASFTGSLKGGRYRANISRRGAIVSATPTVWIEVDSLIARVKDATKSKVTTALLDELTSIGVLNRKIEKVSPRFPGHIHIRILVPTPDKSALRPSEEFSMTQDQFVALLITGAKPDGAKGAL